MAPTSSPSLDSAPPEHRRMGGELNRTPPGVLVAGIVLLLLLVSTVFTGLFETHDPFAVDSTNNLRPPSVEHFFGTDQNGRDVYSRVVEGVRPSLLVGVGATVVGLGIGALLGVTAAI
ncbi:MAG: ABC transporter permease, partial [Acidimicrobiia bacterium]